MKKEFVYIKKCFNCIRHEEPETKLDEKGRRVPVISNVITYYDTESICEDCLMASRARYIDKRLIEQKNEVEQLKKKHEQEFLI